MSAIQTRKFVQSLAFDPQKNKSLWSKSWPLTGTQGSFPSGKQKSMWEAQGQQSLIICFGISGCTVIIYC